MRAVGCRQGNIGGFQVQTVQQRVVADLQYRVAKSLARKEDLVAVTRSAGIQNRAKRWTGNFRFRLTFDLAAKTAAQNHYDLEAVEQKIAGGCGRAEASV